MGGSSGGGGGSAPAIQTQIVREAPGIEERKIGLMDIGLNLGSTPVNIPDYQIAGQGQGTALQQQGLQAAGTTGVGAGYSTSWNSCSSIWSTICSTSSGRAKY
jgi:hypothetical protein